MCQNINPKFCKSITKFQFFKLYWAPTFKLKPGFVNPKKIALEDSKNISVLIELEKGVTELERVCNDRSIIFECTWN